MHKIILDCDNTMGVLRSDIDDGLTFAYLYAHPQVDLMGVTCTFANNHEHVVYYNTLQMMEDMEIRDVPVFKGGRNPGEYDSPAVDFLVRSAQENPGEITVLAIGSLCNIAGAAARDPAFFDNLKGLVVMGGILEPLYLNGSLCHELNFSIDSESAYRVIFGCSKLTILSSQCTQDAMYGEKEIARLLAQETRFMKRYVSVIRDWIQYINPYYGGRDCFINWDLCTAIYVTRPDLFADRKLRIVRSRENLRTGLLQQDDQCPDDQAAWLNIPDRILDVDAFNEEFYSIMKLLK